MKSGRLLRDILYVLWAVAKGCSVCTIGSC
jgi:hypothetical protein